MPADPALMAAKRLLTRTDRKSTRLNSSHVEISYAVFCLKKKNGGFRGPPRWFLGGSEVSRGHDGHYSRDGRGRALRPVVGDFHRAGGFLRFFFFNDTATTEIYTLSLHDALPI